MGKPTRRRNNTAKNKAHHRIMKAKGFIKQNDQRYEDLQPENAARLAAQPPDEDLPGLGLFYCIHCAKYFVSAAELQKHLPTKNHRRKARELSTKPYDLREAEALNRY